MSIIIRKTPWDDELIGLALFQDNSLNPRNTYSSFRAPPSVEIGSGAQRLLAGMHFMVRSTAALVLLSLIGWLGATGEAVADQLPGKLLDAVFPVLRGKSPPSPPLVNAFTRKPATPADAPCGLVRMDLVQTRGPAQHSFEILGEPVSETDNQPKVMLIRLNTLAVDADGSHRAYHPEDPYGNRCQGPADDPASGICAVDSLSSAEVKVYEHSQRVPQNSGKPPKPNPAFITAWKSLWSDISARKDNWVDLHPYFGDKTPENARLYYSKQTDRAVTFDAAIIPFKDNFPCQHDDSRREYFVAATTKPETAARPDGACGTADYLDAMTTPFIVLPGAFQQLKIGDVAIGLAIIDNTERVVFGVVGDRGPSQQIGEASIAFAQKLRGTSDVIKNTHQADALQLETGKHVTMLGVLVLGDTASKFGSDYAPENIERVAKAALDDWSAGNAGRLKACMSIATPNPLRGNGP
jgi:hypothetical protein